MRPLESIVSRAHAVRIFGPRYHPYFLCFDVAMIVGLSVGFLFDAAFGVLSGWKWIAIFAIEAAVYQLALLPLKQRLFGIRSRSFMQDTLGLLLPLYLVLCWAFGQPLGPALDAVGLMLPLVLAIIRVGCFLGGCCYGRHCRGGVRYPGEIFQPFETWRRFTPGPRPAGPVLPIQLLESAVNLALFALLFVHVASTRVFDGSALVMYLVGYSLWRFGAEVFRGARHRPKWGPLAQAQWISLGVVAVGGLWLVL